MMLPILGNVVVLAVTVALFVVTVSIQKRG
ncbi:MAG: hypothetical protein JWM53_3064 [bacterium]|nr:hypothetical protein [bacterium]